MTDSQRRTNTLNPYFAAVFNSNSTDAAAVPNTTETSIYSLPDYEISTNEVLKALQSLKTCKSPGPDKLYPRLLKEISRERLSPLTMLFIMSFQHGIVPSDWKLTNITLIFKKGAGNYRIITGQSTYLQLLVNHSRQLFAIKWFTTKSVTR